MSENKTSSSACIDKQNNHESCSKPYALFLGCTIPVRAQNYEISTRLIAKYLGIEFGHIDNFTCCGYPSAAIDFEASQLMAARNLALAENNGFEICTICTACTGVLTETAKEISHNNILKEQINQKLSPIGLTIKGNIKVKHFARILLEEVGEDKIKSLIKKPLKGIKIAAHYGCHYVKPSSIYDNFDSAEHPTSLDTLINLTGAESIDYIDKMNCCGGALLAVNEELALKITKKKLDIIKEKADAIVLVCPFCSVMYDSSQKKIESTYSAQYDIPVLYYPQLLGLAMGIDPKELGIQMNRVKPKKILDKIAQI